MRVHKRYINSALGCRVRVTSSRALCNSLACCYCISFIRMRFSSVTTGDKTLFWDLWVDVFSTGLSLARPGICMWCTCTIGLAAWFCAPQRISLYAAVVKYCTTPAYPQEDKWATLPEGGPLHGCKMVWLSGKWLTGLEFPWATDSASGYLKK